MSRCAPSSRRTTPSAPGCSPGGWPSWPWPSWSGATAPLIRNAIGGAAGYRVMAIFVAILIMIGALGAYLGTRGIPASTATSPVGSLSSQLRLTFQVRDFRLLLITFVVQALGIGAM